MTTKGTKKTRRKYDASFKAEVMKMVASGRSVSDIAQALGIGENLVYQWKNADKAARQAASALSNDGISQPDLLSENERLRAELRRMEQEREILKKALGIFSRGNQ